MHLSVGSISIMSFNLVFHYGGCFFKDYVVYYSGGNEHLVEIDPDRWSLFEAFGIVKDITQLEQS